MTIHVHDGDLPDGLDLGPVVAVDSETMGLRLGRDRLCVVQLSDGGEDAHLVRFAADSPYDAPNLKRLLTDRDTLKLFHFGRFDIAMFFLNLGVTTAPVYCTKIASKLARTYTDRHGLKDVTKELLGVDVSKAQQSSDWGADALTPEQQAYAASDVANLHAIRARLDAMLLREGRTALAQACFDFLPDRAALTMAAPFMRSYAAQLVRTCHAHGAFAIGGMAAFIPSRRDAEVNALAFAKVREDKQREADGGFDGSWVAHPDLVPICAEIFDAKLGHAPNQLGARRADVEPDAAGLLDLSGIDARPTARCGNGCTPAWCSTPARR